MNSKISDIEIFKMKNIYDNLYSKSKINFKFKYLWRIITSRNNILLAYNTIKKNKGSKTPGVDGKTINYYMKMTEDNLVLHFQNSMNNYIPQQVKRVMIPKPNGDLRPLGIPTIKDRIIQQAIKQVMEPICEAKFYKDSYGFREYRSCENAIGRVQMLINFSKQYYSVDIDLKEFFDNINHKKLRRQIWSLGIHDKKLLKVIDLMLKSEVVGEGKQTKGTPQGGILSPLLANIVLNELDHWIYRQWEGKPINRNVTKKSYRIELQRRTNLKEGYIVRYADDFKILTNSQQSAEKWLIATKLWIKDRLKLDISDQKSKIVNLKEKRSEFLGFEIFVRNTSRKDKKYIAKVKMSKKSKKNAINKIKKETKRLKMNCCPANVYKYNSLIRGLHNYYEGATEITKNFSEIAYRTRSLRRNQLRHIGTEGYKKIDEKKYKRYKFKTYIINDIPLIPIGAIKHNYNKLFNQDKSSYTVRGREIINKDISNNSMDTATNYLLDNFIKNKSVEYNINRVKVFTKNKGKCNITGYDLTKDITKYNCHHKKPVKYGGKDTYNNLIPLHEEVHIIIHAKKQETINRYLEKLKIDEKQKKKINELRKLCNLEQI